MKPVDIYLSCGGIGDAVCGMYAAAGLADVLAPSGDTVRFACRHVPWLGRVHHPGVQLQTHRSIGLDMNQSYREQLAQSDDRKQWYCDNLARELDLPRFTPRQPHLVERTVPAPRGKRPYIVLAPFSAHRSRSWPLPHWKRLSELLQRAGWDVLVTCTPAQKSELRRGFGSKSKTPSWLRLEWNSTPDECMRTFSRAACVVGNDSGVPHLAGLLKVPTVATHAHLRPELLWSHTNVVAVTPETQCRFCAWQESAGYSPACQLQCSALATIGPERVMAAIEHAMEVYKHDG